MATKKLKSIDELASLAGVAKSTVSRALSGSPLVNEETRRRIVELAERHDFRPSSVARSLSTKSSRTIGFVLHAFNPDEECGCGISDPFSLEIMGGVAEGLHALGRDLLVVHIDPSDTGWIRDYRGAGRVDGFILMTYDRKRHHIDELQRQDCPFIAWGVGEGEFCTVVGDDRRGGRLAAERLASTGRRRIGEISGPRSEGEVQARLKGFASGLEEAGIDLPPSRLAHGDYSEASGRRAMEELLAREPDLDAVFCHSDLMAISAMRAIVATGRRVPEDLAVVGYDNLSASSWTTPALTTVSQNIGLAGRMLARDLVSFIENGVVTHTTVPVELVVRASA